MNEGNSELITIAGVARALGISVENVRALEKRGRLPEDCEPQIDLITGTRGWTAEQVEKLKAWNRERLADLPVADEPESGERDTGAEL